MNETKTVRIAGGGFHNAPDTILALPAARVLSADRIRDCFANPELHHTTEALLTGGELNTLCRDMCGIADCVCGSGHAADMYSLEILRALGVPSAEPLFAVACVVE